MSAEKLHGGKIPRQFRRVLFDLCAGAALVERFGNYETYIEADGRVRNCGNKVTPADLQALLAAVPAVTHWNPQRPDGRAYRLPASERAHCLDLLQQTMPLDSILEQARPMVEQVYWASKAIVGDADEDLRADFRARERA